MAEPVGALLIGGTGYGGAELLRGLLGHPVVQVRKVTAVDHVGQRVGDVHWTWPTGPTCS